MPLFNNRHTAGSGEGALVHIQHSPYDSGFDPDSNALPEKAHVIGHSAADGSDSGQKFFTDKKVAKAHGREMADKGYEVTSSTFNPREETDSSGFLDTKKDNRMEAGFKRRTTKAERRVKY
jgi:hypothetical protein